MKARIASSGRVRLPIAFRKSLFLAAAALFLFPALLSRPCDASASESRSDKVSLEGILPGETLCFIRCAGIEQLLADRDALGLFKIWNEPEVQDFFAAMKEKIPELLAGEGGPPIPYGEVWSLLQGEICLAVASRPGLFHQTPWPAMAVALDMGGNREAFQERMGSLLDMVARSGRLDRERVEHRGFEVEKLSRSRDNIMICHTTIENLFVVTFDQPYMEKIIDCRVDTSPALAENPAFVSCMTRAGGKAARLVAYLDFRSFLKRVADVAYFELLEHLDILGLDQVHALCLASGLEGEVSRDRLFIHSPGEKKGILKALVPHPISPENISLTPPDTLFLLDLVFDPELLLSELVAGMEKKLPDRVDEFRHRLTRASEMLGLDLEKEILAPLGDEISFFVTGAKGGMSLIPDFIMTLSIEDEPGFAVLQDKLLTMMQGQLEVNESQYKGRALRHVRLPMPQVPLSPTFTVEDGRLLVASTTIAMKRYLKWLDTESSGLGGSASFGMVMADLPESASMLCYIDLNRISGMAYDMGAPMLPSLLSQSDLPLDAGLLPMTETIVDHMANAAAYMVIDGEGIFLTWRCPFGLGFLATASAAFLDFLIEKDRLGSLAARGAAMEGALPPPERNPDLGAAYMLMTEGNHAAADRRLTSWLDAGQGPEWYRIWALTNRAECRMKTGRHADAVADYLAVSEMDAESRGGAYFQIARAYSLLSEKEKAIRYVEDAASAGHRFFDLHADLEPLRGETAFDLFIDMVIGASNLMRDGDDETAANYLTDWIYSNPQHKLSAWALKTRGGCLIRLGYYADGIVDLEEAVRQNESYKPGTYYDIACVCCSDLEDPERAIHYLEGAMHAGFDDIDLLESDSDLDALRDDPRFKVMRWTW